MDIDKIKDFELRDIIIHVLKDCDGNRTRAAKALKISCPLLYQKMERLGL